jgi:sugar O-acyltransferase (sialic acid O-acetyltransferase NeuD family)
VSDKNDIVLVGYSGHGIVVAEAAIEAKLRLVYYTDLKKRAFNPFELNYIGFDGDADFTGWNKGYQFILGVGDNRIRESIGLKLSAKGETVLNVFHPDSSLSKNIRIGSGIFISRNVSVNSFAIIGDYTILNTGVIIEHECKLGSAVHIAPGAVLAGNVEVGDRSFIGANAVVKQGVKIGKDVIVGAGSVVINDILDGKKLAGNPAKQIK